MKRQIKKLCLLVVSILAAFSASAYDFEVDGIYYNKTSYNTCSVTYKYSQGGGYTGTVNIPEQITYSGVKYSVTEIGNYAFNKCYYLKEVTIPSSVTEIGHDAFASCNDLEKVNITDLAIWCGIGFGSSTSNPLSCAHHLYLNDSEVTELVIPETVTSIGRYAFSGCSGLTKVTIGDSVTEIGSGAFKGCTGLTEVTIPNSVTEIGEYAFDGCLDRG